MMKKITKNKVIEKLISDDIDTIQNGYLGRIESILSTGFRGYDEYTKEDLAKAYFNQFDEIIEVI